METQDRPVEIKDLNKTQLILLAILLSFVVSIATGIVTVTLMQQAPTGVTQTINRVVQQTIEKVAPDYTPGKTQTVIIKEDDMVVDAVSKVRAAIGSVFASADAAAVSLDDAYSIGNGAFLVADATLEASKTYTIAVPSAGDTKVTFDAKVIGISPLGFSILSVVSTDKKPLQLPKIEFAKGSRFQLLRFAQSPSTAPKKYSA